MKTSLQLNTGASVPALGLGTWKLPNDKAEAVVTKAIVGAGYRHIDCASIYGNQQEIGQAFAKVLGKNVKREDVFVTSKLWNTDHHPDNVEAACRRTLEDLQLDYLDLYLIHWGIAFQPGGDLEPLDKDGWASMQLVPIQDTWRAMERLVEKGLARAIGVSNFTVPMLADMLTYANIKPAMNQVELHPFLPQVGLVDFCKHNDIAVTAYSPLAHGAVDDFGRSVVAELAAKYRKSVAQILLNWAVARGTAAIPKTADPKKLAENIDIFDFELTQDEQDSLTALDKNYRTCNPIGWWGVPYFA
ncbi:MAG TPA: aldo/keto reductase [Candidatus Pristimantibacillus sp.]|nr:aldo/keto reductase [Candidatus Pristimantibacillus sp.]